MEIQLLTKLMKNNVHFLQNRFTSALNVFSSVRVHSIQTLCNFYLVEELIVHLRNEYELRKLVRL